MTQAAGRRRRAAALVVAAIVVAQLPGLWHGSAAPAASRTPSASYQPVPDLLPTELAGEPVHRVGDAEVASGRSVLVAGSIYDEAHARSCPSPTGTDAELLLAQTGCLGGSGTFLVGPRGKVLVGLVGPQPLDHETVVVRAHTRDARAQQCSPALRSECEKALVIESIEWRMAMPEQLGKWHHLEGRGGEQVVPADGEMRDRVDVFAVGGVLQERECTSSDPDARDFVGANQRCGTIDDLPVVGSDRLPQAYGRTVVLLVDGAASQYSCDGAVSRPDCEKTLVAIQVMWPSGLVQGQQVTMVDGVPRYVDGAQVLWPGTLAFAEALSDGDGEAFLVVGVPMREAAHFACPPTASAAACEPEPFRAVLSQFGSAVPLADTALALPWGHLVVLRAHVRAPLPEPCGQDRCEAIVPDEIVWDSGSPWVEGSR